MIICHIHITLFHTNPLPSHEIIGIGDGFFIRIGGKVKQLVGYLDDWKKKSVCNLIFKLIISGFVKRMKQKDLLSSWVGVRLKSASGCVSPTISRLTRSCLLRTHLKHPSFRCAILTLIPTMSSNQCWLQKNERIKGHRNR